ncbi:MAG TPA: hypothetical protein VEL03_21025 [Streptosporangiaceae bacterium]|nr:hypothetical protein [Streptosporangiaceae bacterium]
MTEVIRRMEVAFMGASELAADRGRSVPAGLPGVPRVPAERTRIEARSRQRAFGVGMFML